MNAILLLEDGAQGEERRRRFVFERDAKSGCTCDRWGHPCPTCVEDESKRLRKSDRKKTLAGRG